MRIISGKFRGKKIVSLLSSATRPTADRIKENMFNLILNYGPIEGIVVDPFAGSGNLSLECISRGATLAYVNDNDDQAIKTIKQNIDNTNTANQIKISNYDYKTFFSKFTPKTNYLFLDPPYSLKEAYFWILEYAIKGDLLFPKALIIIESDKIFDFKNFSKIELLQTKKYGKTVIQILRYVK